MIMSSALVAKLRFRQVRGTRVTRRIDSLRDAASHAPTQVVSVFRRDEPSDQPKINARNPRGLRTRIADVVQTPTARFWAPANENGMSSGRIGLMHS